MVNTHSEIVPGNSFMSIMEVFKYYQLACMVRIFIFIKQRSKKAQQRYVLISDSIWGDYSYSKWLSVQRYLAIEAKSRPVPCGHLKYLWFQIYMNRGDRILQVLLRWRAWASTVRLPFHIHCSFLCSEQPEETRASRAAVGPLPQPPTGRRRGLTLRAHWDSLCPYSGRDGAVGLMNFFLLNLNEVMVEDAGQPIIWPGYLLVIQDFTWPTVPVGVLRKVTAYYPSQFDPVFFLVVRLNIK